MLDEYAVRFFSMLNEGYRHRMAHYLFLARLATLPMQKPDAVTNLLKQLEWATKEPDDILNSSDNPATTDELKKFLGKI